jgi:hypothetical protein
VKVSQRRTEVDWAECIKELGELHCPQAEKVALVMDNLKTHTAASVYEAFAPQEARRPWDRLELHYTPKRGRWLNIAECELSAFQCQCLDQRIPHVQRPGQLATAWEQHRNTAQLKVGSRFTAQDGRIRLKRVCPVIHGG